MTLLPSATEIVCALGLGDRLVGVSHSCDYPPAVRGLPRMTRTRIPFTADSETIDASVRAHLESHAALYELDIDALERARPDVVVSQALCDVCAVSTGEADQAVRSLPARPTLIDLTPNTLSDVFDDIERVAAALDASGAGQTLLVTLRERRDRIGERTAGISEDLKPTVAFLEWLIPPFNGGHWNPELVLLAGGIDLLGSPGEASRTLDWSEVVDAEPEDLFVACCGFTIERALEDVAIVSETGAWQSLPAVRNNRVQVADGNAFFASPGPRLIDGLEILAHALHPEIHPSPAAGSRVARPNMRRQPR